jgi:hypothetical protein
MLNYTISYPNVMDIVDDLDMVTMSGTRVSPVGLELLGASTNGYAVIGPFQVENEIPHHLWVKGTFMNIEDYCTFSILTSNYSSMRTFEGYSSSDSDRLVVSGEYVHIKWNLYNLGELPDGTDEFYIKVDIKRTGSLSPRLTSLKLGYTSPPEIESVTVDENEVLRQGTATIGILVSDPEEPPQHLDLDVWVMVPGTGEWTKEGISDPLWSEDRWEVTLTTDIGSVPGDYSFRIIAKDRTGGRSEERLETSFVRVLNNIPLPPMISVEPELPVTGDRISITMLSPGWDLEVPWDELRYNLYFFKDGEREIYLDNLTDTNVSLDEPLLFKDEKWEIFATTWDGMDECLPFRIEFTVLNSAPVISYDGSAVSIFEEQTDASFDPGSWFEDPDEDEMEFKVLGPPELSPFLEDGMVYLDLLEDFNGLSWIWINSFDGEKNVSVNITVEVLPVNDIPEWNHFVDLEVMEGDWIFVDIGAIDLHDNEMPEVSLNQFVTGLEEGKNIFRYPNGSFLFRPDNSMVGTHLVEFDVEDSESIHTDSFNLTVTNLNQIPDMPTINTASGSMIFGFSESITMMASSNDEDLIWGDVLSYSWESSIDGSLGMGSEITPQLSPGIHTITVTVMDSEGGSNSTAIEIEVLEKENPGDSVIRTWIVYLIAGLIPFIIALIIGLVIFLLTRTKKEEKKVEEGPPKEEEKEKVAPPEGPALKEKEEKQLPPGPTEEGKGQTPPSRILPPHQEAPEDVEPSEAEAIQPPEESPTPEPNTTIPEEPSTVQPPQPPSPEQKPPASPDIIDSGGFK